MSESKNIHVCAHWVGLDGPTDMGILSVTIARGKEIFSFEYDKNWLQSGNAQILDPHLGLYSGPQYLPEERPNFGMFMDSSPDRWGRVLMQRREAQLARQEDRRPAILRESDYLLGVYDGYRMGGLRFRLSDDLPFLDKQADMASPPWAKLRDLEYASLQLENDEAENAAEYMQWLRLLIAPGGSLGGARPKASVVDENGHLWIAKFPSRNDEINIAGWEYVVHTLAERCCIQIAPARIQKFSGQHETFLTKRFDRTDAGERIHFASAMTLLGKVDGDSGDTGVSYLDLADFLMKYGAQTNSDLEQLWRRIVFNICVSNVDDHLRNHGFLLTPKGWILSPAYDMNPSATGHGLTLNISTDDNAQDLDLAREVAPVFRVSSNTAEQIISDVLASTRGWHDMAKNIGLPNRQIDSMRGAFRFVD